MLQRPGVRTGIPLYLLKVTQEDLAGQVARWKPTRQWSGWLAGYPAVLEALKDEASAHGGSIRREFVHSYAGRDPHELFYVAMAWGFGATNVRWPGQQALLGEPPRAKIEESSRRSGLAVPRRAGGLYGDHRDPWPRLCIRNEAPVLCRLYQPVPGPRPLILDANVLSALHDAGRASSLQAGCGALDYFGCLKLAGQWAADPSWPNGTAEVVEYALLERGRELNDVVASRRKARG